MVQAERHSDRLRISAAVNSSQSPAQHRELTGTGKKLQCLLNYSSEKQRVS
jgi:hypothetical protein